MKKIAWNKLEANKVNEREINWNIKENARKCNKKRLFKHLQTNAVKKNSSPAFRDFGEGWSYIIIRKFIRYQQLRYTFPILGC